MMLIKMINKLISVLNQNPEESEEQFQTIYLKRKRLLLSKRKLKESINK
jgi:hypothetical protein